MNQSEILELARRGEPAAIATLMNRTLQGQGITVSADRQGGYLNIRFEAPQIPNQERVVAFVDKLMKTLDVKSINPVKVFGYRANEPTPVWQQQIEPGKLTSPPQIKTEIPVALALEDEVSIDRFLVCGLGSVGQHCVLNLKKFALREFEVHITAIDKIKPETWEVENIPDLLSEDLVIGDCRWDEVLLKAGVQACRAVLLVTDNESANIEAAIAARRLNPLIRLIVRSSKQSLNQLLRRELGNFVALEPTELPAAAFALAGLGKGILGFFNIGNYRLQVVEQQVQFRDYRFDNFPASMLHKEQYRLLSYIPADQDVGEPSLSSLITPVKAFYQWQPETRVKAGDTIAYIEVLEQSDHASKSAIASETLLQQLWQGARESMAGSLGQKVIRFWQWIQEQQTRQVVGLGLITAFLLWILGAVLLKSSVPGMSWQKAVSAGAILLLGGYGDVFGGFQNDPVPWGVQFICLLITAVSLLFVLGVLGLIADNLLSSRFEFWRQRPPIPKQDHVVVVGFGRIGQRVAALLREFKQPVVAVTEDLDNRTLLTQIPLLIGNLITELAKVHLETAKSVIVVTEDQMVNLEVALMARDAARKVKRNIGLVVRTYYQSFSINVVGLLPDAQALSAYALSAEAFAGAAFGENILGLFRLNEQTILVAEYRITETDSLVGKILAQVAYGYGVVPIFYQRGNPPKNNVVSKVLMPSDDEQLQAGDRLIVLSSINGLRRIERGDITPPRRWQLKVQKPLNQTFVTLYLSSSLATISGSNLEKARKFMENLPGTMELSLYDYQAHRLKEELSRQLIVDLKPV